MKISKWIVLTLLLSGLLALTVTSQISQDTPLSNLFTQSKINQVTDRISLEEKQDCTINYYNSTDPIYSYVTRTRPTYGVCFNPANQSNYICVNGTESYQSYEVTGSQIVLRNTTNCRTNSYVVSVNKGSSVEKREVDFLNWGICVNSTEDGCLAVTCGTLKGGSARNGIFNGCDGGKACQKFLFCQDGAKVLYKGSREDFVKEDPTFHLNKLALKEVEK